MRLVLCTAVLLAVVCSLVAAPVGTSVEPLVAQNPSRAAIRSMPIEQRPNRPIHFYGNAVRRRYHRAPAAAPSPVRSAPTR